MTTFTWMDYTPTPEEEEAWGLMGKEAKVEERKTIWVGEFEFLECNAMGMEAFDICLVHRLHEVKECTEAEMEAEQLDWVVPNEYKGEIAFSQGFMRNLGGNIRRFDKEGV